MVRIGVPYGKGSMEVEVPDKNLITILRPKPAKAVSDEIRAIREAVTTPVKSTRLCEIAKQDDKVAIAITDMTRPCPDNKIIPVLLDELTLAGVKEKDVTIVVGTGLHRPSTYDELREKLGEEVLRRVKVIIHNASDDSELTYLGTTSEGTPVIQNSTIASADVVLATGIIELHPVAGFSGGRKAVAIGTAGEETIKHAHRLELRMNPKVGPGNIEGNVFHETLMEIAKFTKLRFIVNVILDDQKRILKVVAGDPIEAWREGVKYAEDLYVQSVSEPADIVISTVGGHPKDVNLYHTLRAASYLIFSPRPVLKKGGIIIIPSPCPEGIGLGIRQKRFYEYVTKFSGPDEIIEAIKSYKDEIGAGMAYSLAKLLKHASIFIAGSETPQVVAKMFMTPVKSLDEGLREAFRRLGNDARVLVVPNVLHTLPVLR